MNQEDYIKQLEESNKNLQEKLEESEKTRDDFLDKPVYIYMDGQSRSFDNISFRDKNGVFEGELRLVFTMRYIQQDERMFGDASSEMYEESWVSDGRGGFAWAVVPSVNMVNINITTQAVTAKTRKLKAQWTQESIDELNTISNGNGNLGVIDISEIEDSIKVEVDKILHPIKKPTNKEVARYGRKKKHVK
jgi:hypothetical protein